MNAKGLKWSKKRKAIVGGVAAFFALAIIGIGAYTMASNDAAFDESGVTTGAAETGTIVQSVSGSGSLSAEKSKNVLVPADLVVEQVLVKEGDVVEAGTPIAKVSAASVREKRLAIEENIDSIQGQIDSLSSSTEHYDLKKQVLQGQIDDLKADRDRMNSLQESLTLTSDTAGVVGNVNLFENTKTGQTSLKEQEATPQKADTKEQVASMANDVAYITQTSAPSNWENPTVTAKYDARFASSNATFAVDQALDDPIEPEQQITTQDDGAASPSPDNSEASEAPTAETPKEPAPDSGGGNKPKGDDSTPSTPDISADLVQLHGKIELKIVPPVAGAVPQTDLVLGDDAPYTAEVSWTPEAEIFAPQMQYTCIVRLVAKDGFCFASDASKLDVSVPNSVDGSFEPLDLNDDGIAETLKVTAVFPITAAEEAPNPEMPTDVEAVDLGGFDMGGSYDLGGGESSSLTQPGSSYSDTEAIAITVTPDDKMFLDIKVDELDILKVTTDQQAKVKLDALDGETFTGKILKIEDGVSNSTDSAGEGATVKYVVRIEVPRDDRMRYGMTGKAEIVVAEAKDVVVVPIDAVSDIEGQSVVYTSVDDNGMLGSPVGVTTGVSDGTNVEVVEGLSAGDAICYAPSVEGDDETFYY